MLVKGATGVIDPGVPAAPKSGSSIFTECFKSIETYSCVREYHVFDDCDNVERDDYTKGATSMSDSLHQMHRPWDTCRDEQLHFADRD